MICQKFPQYRYENDNTNKRFFDRNGMPNLNYGKKPVNPPFYPRCLEVGRVFNLVTKEADALVQNELGTLHVTNMLDQTDLNKFLNLKIFESQEAYEEHKKGRLYSTCPYFIKGCEGYCSQTNYMRGNYDLGGDDIG